jgi:hypothetical protein
VLSLQGTTGSTSKNASLKCNKEAIAFVRTADKCAMREILPLVSKP